MKNILICGAGGFIGGHMACYQTKLGNKVVSIDIKQPEFRKLQPNEIFIQQDLKDQNFVNEFLKINSFDEIYQFAADMGGSGYIYIGTNDADIMYNSAIINLNILNAVNQYCKNTKIFYSSSACIYPSFNQTDPNNPICSEDSAYPAEPDSEYGWEKLFSERLYLSYRRNKGINCRVARFHNIFGPQGTYDGGKEKAPAALCRKVAKAQEVDTIEIWGSGKQTRSFLYIDECIEAVTRFMESDCEEILNIGSEEMVTINQLAQMIIDISGKKIDIKNIDGPIGVQGRCSDNKLISKSLNWSPSQPLNDGLIKTYQWINEEISK